VHCRSFACASTCNSTTTTRNTNRASSSSNNNTHDTFQQQQQTQAQLTRPPLFKSPLKVLFDSTLDSGKNLLAAVGSAA